MPSNPRLHRALDRPVNEVSQAEYEATVRATWSEDTLLTRILEVARANGWMAYHVRNSKAGIVQGDVGFPDCVLVSATYYTNTGDGLLTTPGVVLFIEAKTERGTLSREQADWRDRLWGADQDWRLWRPSDWPEIVATLQRG